jgi:diguanylate cyclase (GGDEF)-like protein
MPAQILDFEQRAARVGIVATLTLLSTLGVVTYRASVEQEAAARRVAHTHKVIEALQRVVGGVAEAESSVRAYSISRRQTTLRDFEPGIDAANQSLNEAQALTVDNPAQQRVVGAVAPLLADRVRLLHERKDSVERGEPPGVSEDGQRLTELIRTLVSEAINVERSLLRDRDVVAEERATRARLTTLLGVIASLVLVAGAALLVDRQTRRRVEVERSRLRELSLVLELGEMLQACRTADEAYEVMQRVAPAYFDDMDGALSIIAPSRDEAVIVARWGNAFAKLQRFELDECWGLRRSQLHVVGDHEHGVNCRHWETVPSAAACFPLIGNGELLGALHLVSKTRLSANIRERLGVLGEQIALAVANLRLRETLRNQSIRDPLTGLFNRRYAEETLQRELIRCDRHQTALSIALLDVDHFKRFNDTHGHEAGDEVLKQIARYLQQQIRGGDVASRLGGEELMVILPEAGAVDAVRKAQVLCDGIRDLKVRASGKLIGPVTVSIGVAAFGFHGTNTEQLLRSADAALYRAKGEGRDRVVLAE